MGNAAHNIAKFLHKKNKKTKNNVGSHLFEKSQFSKRNLLITIFFKESCTGGNDADFSRNNEFHPKPVCVSVEAGSQVAR